MKYLAAYALVSLSGKKDITAADIKKVLGSANANVSDDDLNRLIASLKGKDINKLIASGISKIGGSGSSTSASTKPAAKQTKKQQPKKQAPKKKEQPKVEEQEDMGLGGGLFD